MGGNFAYNSAVNNFGETRVTNVYRSNVTVINNSQLSYAGGPHGLATRPSAAELAFEHEHHIAVTAFQASHIAAAAKDPAFAVKQNGGHPAIAATARPAQFSGPGVVPARAAGAGHPPEHNGVTQPTAAHEPAVAHAAPIHEVAAPHPVAHAAPPARETPVEAHAAVVHASPAPPHPAERFAPAREPPVQQHVAAHVAPPPHQTEHAAPAVREAPIQHTALPQAEHAQPHPMPVAHAPPPAAARDPVQPAKAPPAKAEDGKKPEH